MDIQTATQRLAQYQNAPRALHFEGLLQIAKYLRFHPDLPLVFLRRDYKSKAAPLTVNLISGSGCWLGDMTVGNVEAHQFGGHQTFWPESCGIESIQQDTIDAVNQSMEQKHFSQGLPTTIGYADTNFGVAVFERHAYSGGVIMKDGTAVITVCCKQSTAAYNTTEHNLVTRILGC